MEAPFTQRESENDLLPNRSRYLVQRVQLLAEEKDKMSTILFDGTPDLYQEVGWKFNSFLTGADDLTVKDFRLVVVLEHGLVTLVTHHGSTPASAIRHWMFAEHAL